MEAHEAVGSPLKFSPTTFLIPSLHDGIELECRIYHPKEKTSVRGAIFAHPYAPLGGSFDDIVVQTAVSTLVSEGYTVGTFNFRGAGASKGRTSWSAKPELTDYASFIGFFLFYMRLCQNSVENRASRRVEHESDHPIPEHEPSKARIQLILGGYSYGSMITMHLPPMIEILERFKHIPEDSISSRLEKEAYRQCGGMKTGDSVQGEKIGVICSSLPNVSYLLVSPLLPPLSWAIAIPIPNLGFRSRHAQGSKATTSDETPSAKLCECPTLAIYSDNDQFTAIKKLRKWSAELQSHDGSHFRCVEIAGAGHFWQSENGLDAFQSALRKWLHAP